MRFFAPQIERNDPPRQIGAQHPRPLEHRGRDTRGRCGLQVAVRRLGRYHDTTRAVADGGARWAGGVRARSHRRSYRRGPCSCQGARREVRPPACADTPSAVGGTAASSRSATQADLARTYGVSQATISRLEPRPFVQVGVADHAGPAVPWLAADDRLTALHETDSRPSSTAIRWAGQGYQDGRSGKEFPHGSGPRMTMRNAASPPFHDAQIAERKYCRPHARPFRLGFPRKTPVFPVCSPAAL
jgi:hypothetical protein